MVVDNPIHPLHGQTVVVRAVLRAAHGRAYLVDHPGGGALVVPESSVGRGPISPDARLALFDPARLLRLICKVDALREHLDTPISAGHEVGPIVAPPSSATSAAAAPPPSTTVARRGSPRPRSRSTGSSGGDGGVPHGEPVSGVVR